jgi:hypothetical protein
VRGETGSRLEALDERPISQEEAAFYKAVEAMRLQYRLPKTASAMAGEIMSALYPILHLLVIDRHGGGRLIATSLLEETAAIILRLDRAIDADRDVNVLRQERGLVPKQITKRRAMQLAQFVWNDREKLRGRPAVLQPNVVLAFLQAVENAAGRRFTYKRARNRSTGYTGQPEGPMLDVVLSALDWAYSIAAPSGPRPEIKTEGVLTLLKRIGRPI